MIARNILILSIGAVLGFAGAIGYVEFRLAGSGVPAAPAIGSARSEKMPGVYATLADAHSDSEIREALRGLAKVHGPQEPLPPVLSRKVFAWSQQGTRDEDDIIPIGHIAAIGGDTELLREMVFTYFGDAEAEAKCDYVEEFVQCHPELFFSLPDTWQLWSAAGGPECCNRPEVTVPILIRFARSTRDGKRILDDLSHAAIQGEMAKTEWGKQTRLTLASQ